MHGKSTAAVIDVGSNTIKVLCAKDSVGVLEPLGMQSLEVRLGGEALEGQPWLTDAKRKAALGAILELIDFASGFQPGTIQVVATSAVRDATNQRMFKTEVKEATGLPLRILSETEEALMIGRGISTDPEIPNPRSFHAIDLGGGSMECIQYCDGQVKDAVSLPLGAVRITRNLTSGGNAPITPTEEQSIWKHVHDQLEKSSPGAAVRDGRALIGCGGAFSVTRSILGQRAGQEYAQTSNKIQTNTLRDFYKEISCMELTERCQIPGLPVERADILPVALFILLTVADWFKSQSFHHSHYNLRFGLLATLFGHFTDKA